MSARTIVVGLLASLPAVAGAAEDQTPLQWLKDHGVQIRKTFNGTTKDALAPASFSYDKSAEEDSYIRADVAVKSPYFWEWQSAGGGGEESSADTALSVGSNFEYHRSTKDFDEVNRQSGALTLEMESGPGTWDFIGDFKFELSHDSVKSQTTRLASLRLGVAGDTPPWPDASFRWEPMLFFRYFPSIGAEHYDKLPITQKQNGVEVTLAPSVDVTLAFARLNVEVLPFYETLGSRVVLVATYTHRQRLAGSEFVPNDTYLLETSFDWYLDADRQIAIGVSHQRGFDPTRNFLEQRLTSIGLKLKVG